MPFGLLPMAMMVTMKFMQADSQHRIVDGFTCHPISYPHLVSIKTISSSIFCGGSLINKYWVVTAGHCCSPNRPAQFIVYVGLARRHYVRRSTVRRRIIHPDFALMPLSSDLCLLQLTRPVRENPYITYMQIANESTFEALVNSSACNRSLTLGFGSQGRIFLNHTEEVIKVNPKLQCVYQRVLPQKYCYWNALVDHTMICALGADHRSADVCKGDSGGPLICKGVQIGLVSAGRGCGIGTPSFYTRIDKFYDFIWKYAGANVFPLHVSVFALNLCIIFMFLNA